MIRLFIATLLAENGLPCDDCVIVSRVTADIYARDEAHARDLIKQHDRLATTKIETLEDKGAVAQASTPGVIISTSIKVYEGPAGGSPLHPTTP